jgi:hypothetical protein
MVNLIKSRPAGTIDKYKEPYEVFKDSIKLEKVEEE